MSNEFITLKDTDIYSLALFVLYKIASIPEYSVIGELPYTMDKNTLITFCNLFGGQTIKVPTIDEIESVMNLILLYQYVDVDKMDYDTAVEKIGFKTTDLRKIKLAYIKIKDTLKDYNFDRH